MEHITAHNMQQQRTKIELKPGDMIYTNVFFSKIWRFELRCRLFGIRQSKEGLTHQTLGADRTEPHCVQTLFRFIGSVLWSL